jgi:hypothetical protein
MLSSMINSGAETTEAGSFSLVRDDVPFRLQRRLGLIPADGLGLVRRAVFWSMLGWLPIAVWAIAMQRAWPGTTSEPLLAHYGIHARLLVAVPLLILAEGPANALVARLLGHFATSGVLRAGDRGAFDAAVARAVRQRDAALPWVVIAALVLTFVTLTQWLGHEHEGSWDGTGAAGFGALWFLTVGRAIYLTLVLAWIWRILLLTMLLRRLARLDLALVPTHPDRAGGLGFLAPLPQVFAPLALAVGAVVAARWAHDAVYHGLSLASLRLEMIAFVAASVVVLGLPLLAFAGPLKREKKQALLDYGALVARHGRLVHERWIAGHVVSRPEILEAPELGPVADTAALYESVARMRRLPAGISAMAPVALAAALPIVAALALQMPVKDLLLKLLKAVL